MENGANEARSLRVDFALVGCVLGSIGLLTVTALTLYAPGRLTTNELLLAFAGSCAVPFFTSWWRAVLDGRLPAVPYGHPRHEHITGWGFLALAGVVGIIVGLAAWATSDAEADRQINSEWGIIVVFGLAIAFASAAIFPLLANSLGPTGLPKALSALVSPLAFLARPFGAVLSFIDSLMVFAVAGGAGAAQPWLTVRYVLLFCAIFPCAVLGYHMPAPYGLVPIAWGFVVAISISRRWAWVEDDREIYMLNRRYTGAHLRIGFGQDLRDEALLSFMSLFFLVPLALRQAHEWSVISGHPIFDIHPGASISFLDWIGYYGTELAKAVPFVDWAEIYQVEGNAPIEASSSAARHVVFATRVLVDLVFLAALLQALSISARNAKQMDLFKAGVLDRLDPFVEPREFRRLVRRGSDGHWEIDASKIADFPKYDAIRLAELSAPEHFPMSIAAKALRRRDGSDNSVRFHEQLLERAFNKKKDAEAIDEVLTALRMTDVAIDADDLSRVRIELNNKRSMNAIRETIMRLILRSADEPAKLAAIRAALIGEAPEVEEPPENIRDAVAPVRRIALLALKPLIATGDPEALRIVQAVAEKDQSTNLRKEASAMLEAPQSPPPAQ